MPNCSVVTCNNRSQTKNYQNNGVTYHIFPKNPTYKEKWIDATGRAPDWFPVQRSVICSEHFQEKCFQRLNKSRRLFEWAIPTLKICHIVSTDCSPPISTLRQLPESNPDNLATKNITQDFTCVTSGPITSAKTANNDNQLQFMASPTVKVENVADNLLACRICLASDVNLFNIRECGLDQVFVDLMGTTLSAWDGFPQHLCAFCRALLLRGRELRARCRRAEHLLKQALMHQHFITTSFIRSIDRHSHKLTHTLSHNCSNGVIQIIKHEDTQIDEQTYPSCIFLTENDIENDVKDFDTVVIIDNEDDNCFDVNAETVQEFEDVDAPHHTPQVNIVESDNKTKDNVTDYSPQVNIVESLNQTVVNESDNISVNTPNVSVIECNDTAKSDTRTSKSEIEKKKTKRRKRPTKNKGQAWRLKPFCEEEGFKEFEEKYNFNIVSLSEEDMLKEMEDRKKSDNYVRSVFKCELCFKGFLSPSTYSNHMKTHDPGRGPHECKLCRTRCLFPTNLLRHMQNAHRLKYKCCACDTVVRTKPLLQARPRSCRLCQLRFFTPAKLRAHIQDKHQLRFSCRMCDDDINSKASAVLHAAFHAGKTFKCDHCDQQFLKATSRSTHMRMSHPGEMADGGTCALCGETFVGAAGLRAHKTRSHEPEPALPGLRCRTCKLRFESAAAIARHRRDQPGGKCGDKHCSCPRCGEACASEQELLAHRVEQHGLHLFTCDMCGKTFESKESVATHIDRVHRLIRAPAPDRPGFRHKPRKRKYGRAPVCEHCGKRVSCMATLKIHMNKHTGERPYKCSVCPKTFMSPQALNVHSESHSGQRAWRCAECPASFVHQSSLYQHRRAIHSGEKAYQCHICAKTFTQSGSLQTHIKYVHMKVKPPPRKRSKKPAT